MRIFNVLNIQYVVMSLIPALAFILIFAAGLGYFSIRRRDSGERMSQIIEAYPGGIEGRNAPFPLVVMLIIAGTVVWSLFYIVFIGILEVRI
jgi:hypothetical protein